jgi:diadenosine tetraphosphate (Ap4A) HIT family hydrolase
MYYKDLLKTRTSCPFCKPYTQRAIKRIGSTYLTYALAPYHKHHLLVITDRHIENFQDLSPEETKSINDLLHVGVDLLKSIGYKNYSILVRNGEEIGKSIPHLHYHIIPCVMIGDLDHHGEERKVLTDLEINDLLKDFKIEK